MARRRPLEVCTEVVNHGFCKRANCTDVHDIRFCEACRLFFPTAWLLARHKETKKHKNKAAGRSQLVRCVVCDLELGPTGAIGYWQHARGRRHQMAMEELGYEEDPGPEEGDVPWNAQKCEICQSVIPSHAWTLHNNSQGHLAKAKFLSLRTALDEVERNKNGIEVDGGDDTKEHSTSVMITNTNTQSIRLLKVRFSAQVDGGYRTIQHFHAHVPDRGLIIRAGKEYRLSLWFEPRCQWGRFQDRLEMYFADDTLKQEFTIVRSLSARVGVRADDERLAATAPYVRPKRSQYVAVKRENTTEGVPPPALAAILWTSKLPEYPIPQRLVDIAYGHGSSSEICERIGRAFLPAIFQKDTYGRHFQILLWIEEERAKRDLAMYDMEGVTLIPVPRTPFYELEVAGLAEKRPSVIVSDSILVKNYYSNKEHWFEGRVHRVLEKSVYLQFHRSFNSYKGQKYCVRFELNRLTLRRMHQALATVFNSGRILFPSGVDLEGLTHPTKHQTQIIRPIDRKIATNPPQLLAVASILYRPAGSVPFVVFGPPGTGKTVTIIEAMRQILLADPEACILACAPSNSAADLLAERLADLGKRTLLRLNAPTRNIEYVPTKVKEFSRILDGTFAVPPLPELQGFRVVVSTCFSASVPSGIGIKRGHFTHIFIDEAGQATEPEVMIPIKNLADNNTVIVLAGDVKQLGPIVRSPVARELGLDKSYLDRLLSNPLYDEDVGSGTTIVKLTKNWRSHAAILRFPNEEFYRNELEACGDPLVTHSLLRWDRLLRPGFPIIFHGIHGKDEQEASSPSYFNKDEASLVKYYLQELFGDRRLKLTPQQVGIISPYNAQVGKIRKILPREAQGVKVGSVEEFQGQERRVIIISTVRSTIEKVQFDLRHTLGFVANARRFNVAVTRAQALLIVVGDPSILSLDPLWKCFINYIHCSGGYTGVSLGWDPYADVDRRSSLIQQRRRQAETEMERLIERTRSLVLNEIEDLEARDEEDEIEGNVDRPWREDE